MKATHRQPSLRPTRKETEWAEKVVAAYEEANAVGSGAVSVDGQMVDTASIRKAQNTLKLYDKQEKYGEV